MLYHPDRNSSTEAAEMMKRLNLAYEILGDPDRRAAYDRARVAQQRQRTGISSRGAYRESPRASRPASRSTTSLELGRAGTLGRAATVLAVGLSVVVLIVFVVNAYGGGEDEGSLEVAALPTRTPVPVTAAPMTAPTKIQAPRVTAGVVDADGGAAIPSPAVARASTATSMPTAMPRPTSTPIPTAMPRSTVTPKPTGARPSRSVDLNGSAEVVIGGHAFTLELATTREEHQQGLSNRDHLLPDAGMLFAFTEESILAFWMKDTLIPLDILFLDQDRRIVDILTMTPQPGVPTDELTVYRSALPAMYAVEVNTGTAAELGLAPGMLVDFRIPSQVSGQTPEPNPTSTPRPTSIPTTAPPSVELDYFTVGSTKDEVLAVQGTPDSFTDTRWEYGSFSWVRFRSGLVTDWNNTDYDKLKARLEPSGPVSPSLGYFTVGSTKDEVLAVQGTPDSFTDTRWEYGSFSWVRFRSGLVTDWNNTDYDKLKARLEPSGPVSPSLGYFTVGSTKDEVLAVQGTPDSFTDTRWEYGSFSWVRFRSGLVTDWNNTDYDKLKARLEPSGPVSPSLGYFTVGSTKDEVLAVQGTPDSFTDTRWEYGSFSWVRFRSGLVTDWNNTDYDKLKARLEPSGPVSPSLGYFTVGSTKDEVLAVQGTPDSFTDTRWEYGSFSWVRFRSGLVTDWNNTDYDKLKARLEPSGPVSPSLGYFTVGSTKDEVLAVQGTPDSFTDTRWEYGSFSWVRFRSGLVTDRNNTDYDKLKARLEPSGPVSPSLGYFTVGSTKDEVLAVQGTPNPESTEGRPWGQP